MPTSKSYPRHLVQFCEKEKKEKKRKAFYLLFKANNLNITNVALVAM